MKSISFEGTKSRERRMGRQRHEQRVARSEETRQLTQRHLRVEMDVVEPEPALAPRERLAAGRRRRSANRSRAGRAPPRRGRVGSACAIPSVPANETTKLSVVDTQLARGRRRSGSISKNISSVPFGMNTVARLTAADPVDVRRRTARDSGHCRGPPVEEAVRDALPPGRALGSGSGSG